MGFAPTGALLQGNLRVTDSREGPRYDGGLWPGRAPTGGSRRADHDGKQLRPVKPRYIRDYLGAVHTGSSLSTLFDIFLFFSICAIPG